MISASKSLESNSRKTTSISQSHTTEGNLITTSEEFEPSSWSIVRPSSTTPPTTSTSELVSANEPLNRDRQPLPVRHCTDSEKETSIEICEPFSDSEEVDGVIDLTQNHNFKDNSLASVPHSSPPQNRLPTITSPSFQPQRVGLQGLRKHFFLSRSNTGQNHPGSKQTIVDCVSAGGSIESSCISDSGVVDQRQHSFKKSDTVIKDSNTNTHTTKTAHSVSQSSAQYFGCLPPENRTHPPQMTTQRGPAEKGMMRTMTMPAEQHGNHHHPSIYNNSHPQPPFVRTPPEAIVHIPQAAQPAYNCSLVPTQNNPSSHYGSLQARPPHYDNYSSDMTRVASAAYTKAMKDAAQIQMIAATQWARAPQQPPIIIQNTTKAIAESQNENKSIGPPPQPSFLDKWADVFADFWGSKLNRFIVFGLTGASLYLYWEWWMHHKRMQIMQRRIQANPLLRLGQLISGAAADNQQPLRYANYF